MKNLIVLLSALVSWSLALTQAYSVDPVKAAWSGWTRTILGQDTISQTITCNFDSLKRVELFVGEAGAGGNYHLLVQTTPGGSQVATGQAVSPGSHNWANFNLTITAPESIVKGKQYEFKFTRSGSDSIQYYYNTDDPYEYGVIGIPGMNPHPTQWDLAARIHGVMDTIGADWFGVNPYFPFDVPSFA